MKTAQAESGPTVRSGAPILDVDAFDLEWPLSAVIRPIPLALAPFVRHRQSESDPGAPVDEGYPYRLGGCGNTFLTWTNKETGAPAGVTCPDCGAGQVCSVKGCQESATRLTNQSLRCEAHR
jgi:hypothetical protein